METVMNVITLLVGLFVGGLLIPWLRKAIPEQYERRRLRLARAQQVIIVYDRAKEDKRRHCFWEDIFKENLVLRARGRRKFVSIADELNSQRNPAVRLFDRRKIDIIVVNWDAINSDPVLGSDRAQELFEHYVPDMTNWMANGGIIIVESQGASWGAIQRAYESFTRCFKDSKVKVTERLWEIGEGLTINDQCKNHPVLANLSDKDLKLQEHGLYERKEWFPFRRKWWRPFSAPIFSTHIESLNEISRYPRKVYRGWFEEYSSDWEPLILTKANLTKANHRAVMLCRPVPGDHEVGACILTTMFIASSEFVKLVENFLNLPNEMRRYCRGSS